MSGFVSFVSSGPGDPDLLTLKAAARLRAADVVLYDDLVAGAILDHARKGATLVSVGKRAGRPSARQEHVSRLLVDYAATGANVVRLKSGDAGVFGRLEEEIEALRAAGVGYEIVPGVTAANAAAATAGLPLTRRHTARRVQFITGADVTGELPDDLNWTALADPLALTAIYMGKRTFPALAAKVARAGDVAGDARASRRVDRPRGTAACSHHHRETCRTAHTGKCHIHRRDPLRGAGGGAAIAI